MSARMMGQHGFMSAKKSILSAKMSDFTGACEETLIFVDKFSYRYLIPLFAKNVGFRKYTLPKTLLILKFIIWFQLSNIN